LPLSFFFPFYLEVVALTTITMAGGAITILAAGTLMAATGGATMGTGNSAR